ncbi:hypothetical protein NFI95_04910 [Acetobacteraceae bacterium KSS8]|uniref:Uncharacterized protein n=1 Tax=Endosaccharibacter trunci TaxID=2812733 RepID=A0ABT1W4H7_9PROT|nr:hypothetical protein [Acetobacteraceae bacterium KSS8]
MSGTTSYSGDPLSGAERVDVRRFCGYPAYGSGASGMSSWRFFEAYGTLEYRMTNMSSSELQVVRQKLATLYQLDQAIPAAAQNLDTDQAAVWTRNRSEVLDRTRLFEDWCRRLAAFIGVPPGPALRTATSIVI